MEPTQTEPKKADLNAAKPETSKTEQTNVLLHQILANVRVLQKDMDLLLESQESYFEDVEDIGSDLQELEVGMGETKDGILKSIEKNSNAVRAQTNRIAGANAAASAGYGL